LVRAALYVKGCRWVKGEYLVDFFALLVNTVVPERHSRKRWGTPEDEQEGENPAFRARKGPREGHRESI